MPGLFEAYITCGVVIAGFVAWIAGSIATTADGIFGWEAAAVAFVVAFVLCAMAFIVVVGVRGAREDARARKIRGY